MFDVRRYAYSPSWRAWSPFAAGARRRAGAGSARRWRRTAPCSAVARPPAARAPRPAARPRRCRRRCCRCRAARSRARVRAATRNRGSAAAPLPRAAAVL